MYELYKHFSNDFQNLTYTEEDMLELFLSESYGDVICSPTNGYSVGKKWCNVIIKMWKEDIECGILRKYELYDDPDLPNWFLDKVLK